MRHADCVFCKRIEAGQYDETTILSVIRFEPLNPVTPGHMLFVPRAHSQDAAHGPTDAGCAADAAAQWSRAHGQSANIITSIGVAATQTVMHTHVHYVPRRLADGLALPWTTQIR